MSEGSSSQTHHAHIRYAANGRPGTRWYDPRDGRERLRIEHHPEDVSDGDRRIVMVGIDVNALHGGFTTCITYETRPTKRGGTSAKRESHDTLDDAFAYLEDEVPAWGEYPRCDAIEERTGVEYDHGSGIPDTRGQYEQADLMGVGI